MIIYKTTNTISGKIYVGKAVSNSKSYFGSGIRLKRAIKKYGKENFIKSIIDQASSKEELDDKEKYWIKTLDSKNPEVGYNIADGGEGNNGSCSEETKKKISQSLKGNKNGLGWLPSKDIREKLSAKMMGNKNGRGNKGKRLSEETKMKISQTMRSR